MADLPVRMRAKVTLDDGSVLEAGIDNRDYRRYDLTRAKHDWPISTEALFLVTDFAAASALIRQGDVPDTDPAKLMERIILTDADGEPEPLPPTGPEPGSD